VTGSSTLAQTGQTVNITGATLAYNNGSFVGTGSGSTACNPLGGYLH
jgi:hypothetical protein